MKNARGFTMMEILVALTLLAAVSAFSLQSFSSSAKMAKNETDAAYNIGRAILEKLHEHVREDQWSLPNFPLSPAPDTAWPAGVSDPKALNGVSFDPSETVTSVDIDGGGEDFRKVEITVTW